MPRKNPQLSQAKEELKQHLHKLRALYLKGELINTLLHPPAADLDRIIQEALKDVPAQCDPQEPPERKTKIRPIRNDFDQLTDLIVEVAGKMGTKGISFGKLGGMLRRIDHDRESGGTRCRPHHGNKIFVWEFAQKLADQIAAMPKPPKTWITRQIEAGLPNRRNAKEAMEWVLSALDADELPALPKFAGGANPTDKQVKEFWELLAILLKDYGGNKSPSAPRVDQEASALAGYTRFLEMKVWQVRWRYCLDRRLEPLTAWLYSLQDPDIDGKLRQTLHGNAPTPAQMKSELEKASAVLRKRKSRKSKTPQPLPLKVPAHNLIVLKVVKD